MLVVVVGVRDVRVVMDEAAVRMQVDVGLLRATRVGVLVVLVVDVGMLVRGRLVSVPVRVAGPEEQGHARAHGERGDELP